MKTSFNWHSETLTPKTIINESYRNTPNVRRFFKEKIGKHFSFDRGFMAYMKNAVGKTLADAVEEWKSQHA